MGKVLGYGRWRCSLRVFRFFGPWLFRLTLLSQTYSATSLPLVLLSLLSFSLSRLIDTPRFLADRMALPGRLYGVVAAFVCLHPDPLKGERAGIALGDEDDSLIALQSYSALQTENERHAPRGYIWPSFGETGTRESSTSPA